MKFFFFKEILCKFYQTWNRIFFWVCKKSYECSKINDIYLLWISSEPIFGTIRETFFFKKKSDFKLKNLDFFFKFPLLRRSFFRDFFLSETSHTWTSGQINFRNFGKFDVFLENLKKIRFQVEKLGFFFQIPTTQEVIFSRFFFCLKLRTLDL